MTDFNAANIEPRPVKWLWRERVPVGFMCLVAGRPGQGKSLLSALIAAEVSTRGGHVLYSAAENPRHEVTVPRLIAAGADLGAVDLRRLTLPDELDQLHGLIVSEAIDLLMLDPIAAHLHRVSRFSDSIREVTNPLGQIAEETGCAIVMTEHVLKNVGSGTHPLQAVAGSGSGIAAAAQVVYIIGRQHDDNERVMLCSAKSNLDDDPAALEFALDSVEDRFGKSQGILSYRGTANYPAIRLLTGAGLGQVGRPPTKMAEAHEWLCQYLLAAPDHTMRARDIREDAQQHGHTRKTLDRAASDMGIVKDPPDGGSPQTTWTLPPELVDALSDDDEGRGDGEDPEEWFDAE